MIAPDLPANHHESPDDSQQPAFNEPVQSSIVAPELPVDGQNRASALPDGRSQDASPLSESCPNLCAINAIIAHSSRRQDPDPLNPVVLTPDAGQMVSDDLGSTDEQLVELWLHGRSVHTRRAYRSDVERFIRFVNRPLHQVSLADLQAFADLLNQEGLSPVSRRRILAAVKSLFAFGNTLGYLAFDTARPLRLEPIRDGLVDRLMAEDEIRRMIVMEPDLRNQMILVVMYAAGLRVSEVCGLRWGDLHRRNSGGQLTVFGKGGKTRSILLPQQVWDRLDGYRGDDEAPLFISRKGEHLQPAQANRIVKKAAQRAGIPRRITSHWLRHGHASHALERGAGIHLVQQTLGHSSIATTGRYLHARPTDSSSNYLNV